MEDFEKKMLKLFLDHPFDYPEYIAHYKNKGYAYRIIKNLIPEDTGIEFEVGYRMCRPALNKRGSGGWPKLMNENSDEVTFRANKCSLDKDLKQLNRLYVFWNKSNLDSCRSPKSGIHIHTNIKRGRFSRSKFKNLVENYSAELNECVKDSANIFFEYKGKYNALDFWNCKSHSIIHRDEMNTIEYRCIEMTWDFRTLLKYIIFCHNWTRLIVMLSGEQIKISEFKSKIKDLINLIKEI